MCTGIATFACHPSFRNIFLILALQEVSLVSNRGTEGFNLIGSMRQHGLEVSVASLAELATAVFRNVIHSSFANLGANTVGTSAN